MFSAHRGTVKLKKQGIHGNLGVGVKLVSNWCQTGVSPVFFGVRLVSAWCFWCQPGVFGVRLVSACRVWCEIGVSPVIVGVSLVFVGVKLVSARGGLFQPERVGFPTRGQPKQKKAQIRLWFRVPHAGPEAICGVSDRCTCAHACCLCDACDIFYIGALTALPSTP